jgi:hypothetical protein
MAFALAGTTEAPHHERTSFRVGGKIFATLWDAEHVNVMLDEDGIRTAVQAHPDCCAECWWGTRLAAVQVVFAAASEDLLGELLTDAWESKGGGPL